jgi:pyridoxine/pyridoxamine 5'-phosphate oxidase
MKVQIVLRLNDCSNAELLVVVDHFIGSMTDNESFKDPTVIAQILKTKEKNEAFRYTLNKPMSETKSDEVAAARDSLERDVIKLKNMTQDTANDPSVSDANRIAIVHSAGMTEKTQVRPQARVFSVKNADVSGTVLLSAQGGSNANEWQYTEDVATFQNRKMLPTTVAAKTSLSGLQKKSDYAFFHRSVVSGEITEWEGPVLITVL